MAPLPIIDDTTRVCINFATVAGVTPRCIHHVRAATADVEQIADDLWLTFVDGMFGPMLSAHEPQSISLTRLDGTSATFVSPRPEGSLTMCLGTGQMMPSVAAVVSLRTLIRGPKARGRQYVGPIVEQAQENGVMDGATRVNLQNAWVQYANDLTELDPAMALCVASYTHAESYLVNSISVDTLTGNQRRRLDQLR